jgi:hypothetical protein
MVRWGGLITRMFLGQNKLPIGLFSTTKTDENSLRMAYPHLSISVPDEAPATTDSGATNIPVRNKMEAYNLDSQHHTSVTRVPGLYRSPRCCA